MCNVWHTMCNVWHAMCNVWHNMCNVWHAMCNVWHIMCNVWHAMCDEWWAICGMPCAMSDEQYVAWNVQCVTCHVQCVAYHGQCVTCHMQCVQCRASGPVQGAHCMLLWVKGHSYQCPSPHLLMPLPIGSRFSSNQCTRPISGPTGPIYIVPNWVYMGSLLGPRSVWGSACSVRVQ